VLTTLCHASAEHSPSPHHFLHPVRNPFPPFPLHPRSSLVCPGTNRCTRFQQPFVPCFSIYLIEIRGKVIEGIGDGLVSALAFGLGLLGFVLGLFFLPVLEVVIDDGRLELAILLLELGQEGSLVVLFIESGAVQGLGKGQVFTVALGDQRCRGSGWSHLMKKSERLLF